MTQTDDLAPHDLAPHDLALLDEPFADDDLTEQLAAKAPRRIGNRWTVGLAALLLAVGGFAAGAQVQKSYGTQAAAAPAGSFPQAGAGRQPQAQPSAVPITGKVKLVNGTTVYVELADGTVVTVRTGESTTVQRGQTIEVGEIATGSTVTVEGQRTGETVTATKVISTG